ncbi:exodeoxyribonuclease V subunit gamma [Candidatus Annandia adelgestsuga]|uniref:exodeoxyribonuclease V subunit gamma n=1 Tax=Candidatus Annandia adelgestsuga TaxID=1302411 RepID=UPI000F7E80EF|nr:exodeoxyribonuclease V subunit gamma [Candidatus Annandia adelgestsuga]
MIYTYHSNEINILKRITYLILKNNNFKKGTILLSFPHKNFLKIIKIFLLKKYIIHNNIKFMLHNEIINFILNIFFPKKINNIFSKNFFYWKIVNFLSIYNNYKKINNFKNFFLKKILKKSILKFSDIVSDIFFKYLLYKPNIINNWIKNKYVKNIPIKEQNWQIYLLKKI